MVPWFLVVPAGPDHQLLPKRNKKIHDQSIKNNNHFYYDLKATMQPAWQALPFGLVSEKRKTGFGRARNETRAFLLVPFFARSLTFVPRSLLLHPTETLAAQASYNVE